MVTSGVADESATGTRTPMAPRIDRCGTRSGGPLLLKCDDPAVISVDVTGQPPPDVQWHVAGRRVRKSARYRTAMAGQRHTLTVLRVTDELEKGVWVMATNAAGEDSCLVTVKTYKVLTGLPNTFHESVQNARQSVAMLRRKPTQQSAERPFSPEAREVSVTSPTPSDWNTEMAIRNRMRSVDDLMYYGRWKRESLQALAGAYRQTDQCSVDGAASLNQSYSCASTLTATAATDDETQRPGQQRRRRTLRLRRRPTHGLYSSGDSIASAPAPRPVNLDDSVGSAALDVDSMFRFFASSTRAPVTDKAPTAVIISPSENMAGLPPSGLPPSGATATGRTTSVRRTSLRRRRKAPAPEVMTDVTGGSSDNVSSTFDDVQMTSSTVDVTATVPQPPVAIQPEIPCADRSRPVRKLSLRRRRRTGDSPAPGARDPVIASDTAAVSVAEASTTSAATVSDVIGVCASDTLWELCGEKLNVLCRRILDVDTDHINTGLSSTATVPYVEERSQTLSVEDTGAIDNELAEVVNVEETSYDVEVLQPSEVVEEPMLCADEADKYPAAAEPSPTSPPEDTGDVENELASVAEVPCALLVELSQSSEIVEEPILRRPTREVDNYPEVQSSQTPPAEDRGSIDTAVSFVAANVEERPLEVVQPSEIVEKTPLPRDEEAESPGRPRNSGVFYSVDLSAFRLSLIPDVVPDEQQLACIAASTTAEEEDSCQSSSDDVDNDLLAVAENVRMNDESLGYKTLSNTMDTVTDDVPQKAQGDHIPPVNGEHAVEPFQMSAYSAEHLQAPGNGMISDEDRTDNVPLTIDVDDVHRDSVYGDDDASAAEQHPRAPDLDIGAMLSPSVDLRDILETIYTLTGSGVDGLLTEQSTGRHQPSEADVRRLESTSSRENSTRDSANVDNGRRRLPTNDLGGEREAKTKCLDRSDDDEENEENSLDLDPETYDCDMSPTAADIAESLHFAVAEDFDDLDMADEYDLDDDDIV